MRARLDPKLTAEWWFSFSFHSFRLEGCNIIQHDLKREEHLCTIFMGSSITCQWHLSDVDLVAGADCPFAHSEEELLPMPDLAKTKMCYNYFRRRGDPGWPRGPVWGRLAVLPLVSSGLTSMSGDAAIQSASLPMALVSFDPCGRIPFGLWRPWLPKADGHWTEGGTNRYV